VASSEVYQERRSSNGIADLLPPQSILAESYQLRHAGLGSGVTEPIWAGECGHPRWRYGA